MIQYFHSTFIESATKHIVEVFPSDVIDSFMYLSLFNHEQRQPTFWMFGNFEHESSIHKFQKQLFVFDLYIILK